ncbi:MAG TPA: hypothetical protein VEW47_07095 [Candidatus Dormibacteraeota bacterium]|nr:hypothetical protein [Candidatus Dormibacteraeota bacterium]
MPSSRSRRKKADREPTSRAERRLKGLKKGQRLRSNRQALLARQRQRARRERLKQQAEQKQKPRERLLGQEQPPLPADPCGSDYGSRIGFTQEKGIPTDDEPLSKKKRVRAPRLRRALLVEPGSSRPRGPLRGGESAESWRSNDEYRPASPGDLVDSWWDF